MDLGRSGCCLSGKDGLARGRVVPEPEDNTPMILAGLVLLSGWG